VVVDLHEALDRRVVVGPRAGVVARRLRVLPGVESQDRVLDDPIALVGVLLVCRGSEPGMAAPPLCLLGGICRQQ
jgi:hypothetical protein